VASEASSEIWGCACRLAIIIELGIKNWPDAGVLLAIQFINATIGWYETMKSGHAVAALKASLKPEATVKRDGKMKTIDAALVVPGDCVLLGSGSAVPADCMVNAGIIEVDQSALTGPHCPFLGVITMPFREHACNLHGLQILGLLLGKLWLGVVEGLG
jgi:H+-transporting ATPase